MSTAQKQQDSHTGNIESFLESVRAIAQEGLTYATGDYDIDRYKKLLELTSKQYANITDEQQEEIKRRLFKEHGSITPKVGVDAAIMNEDGAVLMLKRSDGAWQMPAGWVDVGESLFGTAQRETFEETGLKIVPLGYVAVAHKTPDKYPGVASQINICVGSQTVPSDSKIILSHEHTDYKWIHDVEEIDNWHIGQKRFFPRIFEAYKDQSFIPGIQD
ncbi:NUDIX hydrolase [candidate division TM7 genomosp. GTL1]|nr:NUDIX hydrolase [candidate division TM7 genomosp. GTL1]